MQRIMRSFIFFTSHTGCYFMFLKDPFQNYINHKNLDKNNSKCLYLVLSNKIVPGKFYDAAKVHKLSINDPAEESPLLPVNSNVNTAT